ncbi:MAG: PAQR family membrane homeostasis protein TrhA [Acidimicrobiales bacterium]
MSSYLKDLRDLKEIRDPIPVAWTADRPVRLSGETGTPRLRGWMHLGAALVTIPAGAALVAHASTSSAEAAIALYVTVLLVMFSVSASYHLIPMSARARYYMRRADHATIYVFIAAAYTPFCLLAVGGTLGSVVLGVVWAGAGAGVAVKLTSFDRLRPLCGGLYIVLGWLAVVTLPSALSVLTGSEVVLFVATGLAYTAGAAVLALRRPDPVPDTFGYHEVWHSLVVVASACYFLLIWALVTTAALR